MRDERPLPTPRFAGYPSMWKKGATPFLVTAVALGVLHGLALIAAMSFLD
jgi:hypothetical protein